MMNHEYLGDKVIAAFREQEVEDKFAFVFIGSRDPDEMSMSWAYGDGAKWTAATGLALLERVVKLANAALDLARHEAETMER